MEDASVTITNIFELFKQTTLIDADKDYVDSDNRGELEKRIFCTLALQGLVGTKFCKLSVKSKFPSNYVGFVL